LCRCPHTWPQVLEHGTTGAVAGRGLRLGLRRKFDLSVLGGPTQLPHKCSRINSLLFLVVVVTVGLLLWLNLNAVLRVAFIASPVLAT
jgi:hypothetical protein